MKGTNVEIIAEAGVNHNGKLEIAKKTGAKVKGITLSENQLTTARRRTQEEGLNEKIICVIYQGITRTFKQ